MPSSSEHFKRRQQGVSLRRYADDDQVRKTQSRETAGKNHQLRRVDLRADQYGYDQSTRRHGGHSILNRHRKLSYSLYLQPKTMAR